MTATVDSWYNRITTKENNMGRSYLVLDDNSTFATDGYFVILTEGGQEQLNDHNDMKCVHPAQGVETAIKLQDLLEAYDKVHGTNHANS